MKPYYEQNGITIYHGDAQELSGEFQVDLLCTDPPYGIGAAHRTGARNYGDSVKRHMTGIVAGKVIKPRDYGDSAWDDSPPPQEVLDAYRACSRHQIIFGGNYFTLPPAKCVLVWDKLRGDTDFADGELAWTNLNKTLRIFRYRWNGFLVDPNSRDPRCHPTQKPVAVMKWAIRQAPADCGLILDPFMGSGTTLVAAKDLGLHAIGIEREEKYCEIAANRLAQEVLALA